VSFTPSPFESLATLGEVTALLRLASEAKVGAPVPCHDADVANNSRCVPPENRKNPEVKVTG
jgi:hypothetical protein